MGIPVAVKNPTKSLIVQSAQTLIQKNGLFKLTIQEIAEYAHISLSTPYQYFEGIDDIRCQAVKEYRMSFVESLYCIARDYNSLEEKLSNYVILHKRVLLDDSKICLYAALASEFPSLSTCVQKEIKEFIKDNQEWIKSILLAHKINGDLPRKARIIVAGISGLMVNARIQKTIDLFYDDCLLSIESSLRES